MGRSGPAHFGQDNTVRVHREQHHFPEGFVLPNDSLHPHPVLPVSVSNLRILRMISYSISFICSFNFFSDRPGIINSSENRELTELLTLNGYSPEYYCREPRGSKGWGPVLLRYSSVGAIMECSRGYKSRYKGIAKGFYISTGIHLGWSHHCTQFLWVLAIDIFCRVEGC